MKQITEFVFEEILFFRPGITETELYTALSEKLSKKLHLEIPFTSSMFRALIHSSFAHETKTSFANNERLEFLGDAVLELIVTDSLINKLPSNFPEGKLSKIRSAIVNEDMLANFALDLKLDKFILLGKGELKKEGHKKNSILSDTFEALIGAIYQSLGYDKAKDFVLSSIKSYEKHEKIKLLSEDSLIHFDSKSRLQEIVMKNFKELPVYKCSEINKNGEINFEVELEVVGKKLGKIVEKSKKKGMQKLAKKVLINNLLETLEVKKCY